MRSLWEEFRTSLNQTSNTVCTFTGSHCYINFISIIHALTLTPTTAFLFHWPPAFSSFMIIKSIFVWIQVLQGETVWHWLPKGYINSPSKQMAKEIAVTKTEWREHNLCNKYYKNSSNTRFVFTAVTSGGSFQGN